MLYLLPVDKPLTFREACTHPCITEDNLYNDGDENKENSLWKQSDGEEQSAVSADDEGDIEVFFEKKSDSSDDEEEPEDSAEKVDQNDSQVLRPGGISYTSRPIPSKRRLKNVITETPRAIVNPWSENASFEALISEEILRIKSNFIVAKLSQTTSIVYNTFRPQTFCQIGGLIELFTVPTYQ